MIARERRYSCPVCKGTGRAESERRRYRKGMNFWYEDACRACHGDGVTTRTLMLAWQAIQAQTKRPAYLLEGEQL